MFVAVPQQGQEDAEHVSSDCAQSYMLSGVNEKTSYTSIVV